MQAVVVGAGLAGLSAACHLRERGHDVLVLERDGQPGGRAGRLDRGGYSFDTGPTVLTMPNLVRDCFAALGEEMDDHLTLKPVDPMYRATFEDGSTLHVRHGREAMTQEILEVCGPKDAAAFGPFCDWLTELYELEMPTFIDRSFDSPLDLAWPLGPVVRLVRMGGFRKLASVVSSHFDDPRLQRMFSFQSMYAGLAPYEALAIYCVITYMDSVAGVFFPEGGMHSVPSALASALVKAGVDVRLDAPVERVVLADGDHGRVQGVLLEDGEHVEADVVVTTPDLPVAYRTLMPGMKVPRAARKGRYSPSCLVWHAGVRGTPPVEAAHHNIHFGKDWDGAFRALLEGGVRMPDPSILVTVPSIDEPDMAPPGCSTLYVLEPTPNLDGRVDWGEERDRAHEQLSARVASFGYPVDVEVEELVDPRDWESQGMERGTPFALSHHFFQTGPFRPSNVDAQAPGLVLAGSGTVPGVGVPMVLVSGRLAAERVDRMDHEGTRRR